MAYRERNYRNLKVWGAAHTLTLRVYNVTRSFPDFEEVAYASASEADYQLLLARDVGYLQAAEYDELAAQVGEIRRMLASLRRTLRKNSGTTGSRRSAVAFR